MLGAWLMVLVLQWLDGHNHTITGGSSAGNTGNLS